MKLLIDTVLRTLTVEERETTRVLPLYGAEAFAFLSTQWLKVGWNEKYSYGFSWMGRPVIQLPEDLVRAQEVLHRARPDVIVETGVAHGGSLVFYASLCKAMGKGRVIGVDIEIRPDNRAAIEAHELSPLISLIEGDSVAPQVLRAVRALVRPGETVMVLLDSNHSRAHVERELEAYAPLVTSGSYLVATDGIMGALHDVPRGDPAWAHDNPAAAAAAFAGRHPEFTLEEPPAPFRQNQLAGLTYWPGGWLRRR